MSMFAQEPTRMPLYMTLRILMTPATVLRLLGSGAGTVIREKVISADASPGNSMFSNVPGDEIGRAHV